MKLEGLSTGVLREYMDITASVSKELIEVCNSLRQSEDKGRFPVGTFKKDISGLMVIHNDYTDKHNVMHRELDKRMTKSLGLKTSIIQVGSMVRKVVDSNIEAFYTDEQYSSLQAMRKKKLDEKKTITAKKGKGIDNPVRKMVIKK